DSIGASTGGPLYEAGKSALGGLMAHAETNGSATSLTQATITPAQIEIRSGDTKVLTTLNTNQATANIALPQDNIQQIEQSTQYRSEAGQVLSDIAGQFADKAHETMFEKESKVYRVVCKQEPCTYDPAIQSDPNRRDSQGNSNVVMMELTQEEISN